MDAKAVAEKQVLALTEDFSGVKNTYNRKLLVCYNDVKALAVQLISAQKKADEVAYEPKCACKQSQSGQ